MNDATGKLAALVRAYLLRRYAILFFTLLSTFMLSPILSALKFSGALVEWMLAASLLAAILPVNAVRNHPRLLVGLGLIWLARPLTNWSGHEVISALVPGIWATIGLVAAGAALRFAMRADQVDAEHLYAALSAYLLAGIYFGLFYWVLEQVSPGTFTATRQFSKTSALYFSFVTLATLGYGDITPSADVARGLAIVEGVGGQLFLAVLVARLVSLYSKPANQSS